ncbi:helix-turn-helix domain-containing protein [Citrobacter freundii]|uniref:Helix-turn-helix domain-containing protein n=1 Tax=Citrobacter freundii TaxID=546 RepID=A0A7W3H8M1_CITFR|nr:helix-turn-helix domain-containing protein [Citrobacter freundii]MBA8062314.1 helix-turn-helix domain-containing protein [Citrobacter freundii]
MGHAKESDFAFDTEGKESISTRLRKLIGKRTVRAAANHWGLSFSTLNNYLTRGTEPSLNVAIKIANIEDVSVEWLATGVASEAHSRDLKLQSNASVEADATDEASDDFDMEAHFEATRDINALTVAWQLIFEALSQEEVLQLVKLFMQIGAKGIMEKLRYDGDIDAVWNNLNTKEKEQLIRLHDQVKKGSLEADISVAETGLSSDNKKAG